MKKIFWILLLMTTPLPAQQKIWQTQTGGKHAEYLYDGLYTLDYGFLMVGGSFSASGDVPEHLGMFDAFVTKIDEDGRKEWTRVWGGKGNDIFRCIANTQDGGYMLAASSSSGQGKYKKVPHIGQDDIWLIQIDITGKETKQLVLGGAANDYPVKVLRTRDGGYLIGAVSYSDSIQSADSLARMPGVILKHSPSYGNADYWIIKLDANYRLQWEKTLGGKQADILTGLVELPGGQIILAGYSNSQAGDNKTYDTQGANDWWIIALSPGGNILWQRQFGGEGNDELYALAVSKDGRILAGGFVTKENQGKSQTDMALVKWDERGNLLWKKTFDRSHKDILQDILVNDDGSLILGGYATRTGSPLKKIKTPGGKGNDDFWLLKTGAEGKKRWEKFFGTPGKDVLQRIIALRDGGYVLTGTTKPWNSPTADADFLIMKIADPEKPLRKPLPLEAVPNPAGDYTRIVIGRKYQKGHLILSDLDGHILDEFNIRRQRIIPLKTTGLRPGIYIVKVTADDMENSIKIIKN